MCKRERERERERERGGGGRGRGKQERSTGRERAEKNLEESTRKRKEETIFGLSGGGANFGFLFY